MTISVLSFGVAREIFGSGCIWLELDEGASSDTLRSVLLLKYPELKKLASFMVAINNEYAQGPVVITAGDEVAIIPPVSGG